MQAHNLLDQIRDNIFLIMSFTMGVGVSIFSVLKPWKGGLWKYPSDPTEQKRLTLAVFASLIGTLFMLLHIYTRR